MTANRFPRMAAMGALIVLAMGSTGALASSNDQPPAAPIVSNQASATPPAASDSSLPVPAYVLAPDFGLVAQTLGLSPAELVKALRSGQTVADLAEQQNVDFDSVVRAATTFQRASAEADVAEGQLTDKDAAAQEADDQDTTRSDLSSPGAVRPGVGNFRKQYGVSLFEQAASALKMDAVSLMTALRGGKSINDLAASAGINVQAAIIDPLVNQESTRLQALVTAGSLTQAQADTALQRLKDYLTWRVATPGTGIGAMGRGMGPGFGRGMGSTLHPGGGPGNGRGLGLGRAPASPTATPTGS